MGKRVKSTVLTGKEAYPTLPPAEQRRWRLAFMRYLDRVAEAGLESVPRTADDFDALFEVTADRGFDDDHSLLRSVHSGGYLLPFRLTEFPRLVLDKLVAVWKVTTAGAKASATQSKGKWRMLSTALHETWGCPQTWRALETEWLRHGGNHRTT
jgi:hypothetical protein